MATVDCDRAQREGFEDDDDEGMSFGGRLGGEAGFPDRLDGLVPADAGHASPQRTTLHRIAEVRRRQGVTLRNVARRLGMSLPVVRRQEQADCDLRLSDLQRWQEVLEVPVAELLVEGEGQLSGPVLERSRMVKLMKTAAALRERCQGTAVHRMVEMLVEQILEIMPELADVTPWHTVGQRRTLDEVGRVARTPVPEEIFRRPVR
jgi:transcriptional regulator with XRE-family HTH domain